MEIGYRYETVSRKCRVSCAIFRDPLYVEVKELESENVAVAATANAATVCPSITNWFRSIMLLLQSHHPSLPLFLRLKRIALLN